MAEMDTAAINDLPDSAFAYIEPGGKVVDGKTEPRSLRHFPIHDAAHVRNALARAPQSPFGPKAMPAILRAAKKFGVEVAQKGSMAAQHSAAAGDIIQDIYELIDGEVDDAHVATLQQAAAIIQRYLSDESSMIGRPGDDIPAADYGKAKGMKTLVEIKAEPMDSGRLDRWLKGEIPRRKLVLPFTGPLPGGKAGLDLDGEYFDATTDWIGPFPALRKSRERLVDWHHDMDPTGVMKGVILGREVLDTAPEEAGLWADWWARAGEDRLKLVAELEKRNVPIYGSSQAVRNAVRKADDGHIELWPIIRDTVTTSPQNIHAVIPSLKALFAMDLPDEIGVAAYRAALVRLRDLEPTLRATFGGAGSSLPRRGEPVGKAGRVLSRKNEALVAEIADRAERLLVQLRKLTAASEGETAP
jgi:hypothetical protein